MISGRHGREPGTEGLEGRAIRERLARGNATHGRRNRWPGLKQICANVCTKGDNRYVNEDFALGPDGASTGTVGSCRAGESLGWEKTRLDGGKEDGRGLGGGI